MSMKIETPPVLSGANEQQLRQVYSYLYRLSENLNVALNAMERETKTMAEQAAMQIVKESTKESAEGSAYNQLRSLIINTAEVIHAEMDTLETQLSSSYSALSAQFGSFEEQIDTRITATARNVIAAYDYDASIEALQAQAAGFEAYQLHTEGYIKQGFIDYDDSGVPILGVAIGQNLTSTTVTVDGEDYEQLDAVQSCAFYTADRVSFRINGQEVAYVSNRKLYIGDVEITGSVVLGPWQMSTANGFTIKWIEG